MAGQTPVLDTADWELPVPLKTPLNLDQSRLTATLTGQWGGPAVAVVDSLDGSVSWIADPVTRLTDSLLLKVPRSARGAWLAVGANGLPALVTVYFDIERTLAGSTRRDPLGRSFVSVYPATDSPAVLAAGGAFQAVLTAIPGGSAVLPALQTGPQGARGDTGTVLSTYPVAITQDGETVIPYPVQYPPLVPSTVHMIVNGEEYFAPDITVGPSAVTWASHEFQLETSDRVVLRYT